MHTPTENIKPVFGLSVAITAATTNGVGINCDGFENALVNVYGAPSGGGTTSDFKVQESADDSAYSDVPGAVFTQITTAGGAKQYVGNINLASRLKFLRVVHTGAGGAAAGQAYGEIILCNARRKPVTQSNSAVFSV